LFLRGYEDRAGQLYRLAERPDRINRDRPAIDCLASMNTVRRLPLSTLLVEPFEGQKADDQPFLAVFERLQHQNWLFQIA
jgi:hypothetical protein